MVEAEIAERADFGVIRYAQLWEDADVLVESMGPSEGADLLSICSAGDNALALLTLDPKRVVAVDLSRPQIECLRLRLGAYRSLTQPEFLELMGARPSGRRRDLLGRALEDQPSVTRAFWRYRTDEVIRHGAGGIGKFERYFRIFRRCLLPLVHSRQIIDQTFVSRSPEERRVFLDQRFNTWRWRLLLRAFFSRFMMGRLGRDKAFFDHIEGSVSAHVARRIEHAAVQCDPAENPYLHWIMKGHHGAVLPLPWRPETYDIIRARLERIELRHESLESFIKSGARMDGFNLSDIFEYMSSEAFHALYGAILDAANPQARLVYWNMMVPRRVPPEYRARVTACRPEEDRLKSCDKAFFYSDFVIEKVK
ncbi:MAG: DUF3419 family protein [Pseudomonadota bacterium]